MIDERLIDEWGFAILAALLTIPAVICYVSGEGLLSIVLSLSGIMCLIGWGAKFLEGYKK